ncbi:MULTISPECIES: hypothetical protein [Paenibacillus]|uniref:Uncharacterized protein n=1 Tax=Paenibacillus odorifer TaxID=189426 RepID=A0A1R0X8D1_9BACL|nr:hypothetical protein [Paenibacillus odorifer]OMD30996.1 hypothetical protein BJP51_01220 [Paenibacillus odorifer]
MLLLTVASFLLFLSISSPAWAQAVAKDVVSFASTEGLTLIKEGLSKDPEGYGYANDAEISEITIGEGMQIYFIDGAKLKQASNSLIETVIPQEIWEFLVLSSGVPKSKMIIQKDSTGPYQVTEFGGNPDTLAYVIQSLHAEGAVSEPTLIRERDEYIAAFKKDNQELIIAPQQASAAESKGLPSNLEPHTPEHLIEVLQTMQNDSSDDEQDGSGTLASAYYADDNNHLTRSITISAIIALVAVFLIWAYLRRRKFLSSFKDRLKIY